MGGEYFQQTTTKGYWGSGFNHGVIIPAWEPGPRGILDVSGVVVVWRNWQNHCLSMNGVCINTPNIPDNHTFGYNAMAYPVDGFNATKCSFRDIIIDKNECLYHYKTGGTGNMGPLNGHVPGHNAGFAGVMFIKTETIATTGPHSQTSGNKEVNDTNSIRYLHGDLFGASHGMTCNYYLDGTVSAENSQYMNLKDNNDDGYTSVIGYSIAIKGLTTQNPGHFSGHPHFGVYPSSPESWILDMVRWGNTSSYYNLTDDPYGGTLWTTLSSYNYYDHLETSLVQYLKNKYVYAQGHFVNGITRATPATMHDNPAQCPQLNEYAAGNGGQFGIPGGLWTNSSGGNLTASGSVSPHYHVYNLGFYGTPYNPVFNNNISGPRNVKTPQEANFLLVDNSDNELIYSNTYLQQLINGTSTIKGYLHIVSKSISTFVIYRILIALILFALIY